MQGTFRTAACRMAGALGSLLWLGLLVSCTATPPEPATPGSASRSAPDAAAAPDTRRSGWHDMSPATQALQNDDTQNPAFLWVAAGEQRFRQHCQQCHQAAALRDSAARHPAWDATSEQVLTLSARIQHCHRRRGGATPPLGSDELLADEAHVAWLGRGRPIQAAGRTPGETVDAQLRPWLQEGQRLWHTRMGAVALSCADCHDRLAGQRLAGSRIPQGHPTGYPAYRLEWQTLGSLERRLQGCMTGVRAEPFAPGAREWVALELALKARAAGMPLDAPAVRP
jgi:sulfur-oxidizing protein SoxA